MEGPIHFAKTRVASKPFVAIFVAVLAVTFALHVQEARAPYTYRHGYISAVFATSARTFERFGIFELGGVPVDNNPPIATNDSYVHWPPAFPLLLSLWFRVFGVSESVAHLWMLMITLGTALLVFAVARIWLGTEGGALAGSLWLTMPVVVHYSHIVVPESLAILMMLVAVFAFLRTQPWLAASAAFFAVCTSWEAAFLPVGLWIAAITAKRHDYRQIASMCTGATILALIFVGGLYAGHNPALVRDALQTAEFRMGLSPAYSQQLIAESTERYVGLDESIGRILLNFPRMLGIFGAAALVLMIWSPPSGGKAILYALGTPWLLWCIVMRNHMAVHDIEMQLAGPLAAIALAWVGRPILKNTRSLGTIMIALAVTIQPWLFGTEKSPEDPVQIMGFSEGIKRATASDAVVLSPLASTIPLYYSDRHLIRNIPDETALWRVLPYVRHEYPSARLYWATPLFHEPWVHLRNLQY